MNDVRVILAHRMRECRNKQNLSLAELGDLTGYSTSRLSNYEQMIRLPNLMVIYDIAKALGVDPGYMLGLDYFFPEFYEK